MTEPFALLHLAAGAGLVAAAWLIARHIAEARPAIRLALLVDAAPLAAGALLLALAAGRPLFAGTIVLALAAAFALADHTMRETLREPVVFSESVELPQVFTHPHLYLPFAGPGLVLGGAAAAVALALALLVLEPPLWMPHPAMALAATVAIAAAGWLAAREPLLGTAAALLRRLGPSGEPFADAATLGPFAMLLAHTVIARAERRPRQAAWAPAPVADVPRPAEPTRHPSREQDDRTAIVVVQCESFFDARRLSPLIPRGFLAGFDACCAAASRYGRLEVPGWGANTMRAEFAVLTGIPEAELGYDRFNPYYALARVPIESQVWRLRRAGYRTICLHPFDRRFFRRDLAMPALGFEEFRGRETLGGGRVPPYCPDPDLARHILRTLDSEGQRSFVFAITMGNHGPWLPAGPPLDPAVARLFDPADIPGGAGLLRYLDGLRRSDEMLQILLEGLDGLERRGRPTMLAFYGDHLPSLSAAFAHFGFDEGSSDYVMWAGGGAPQREDLPAHALGRTVVDSVLGGEEARRRQGRSPCLAGAEPASLAR